MPLITALPYGFIDASGQWFQNAQNQRPAAGLTKVYWNADIKSIRERYEDAKAMNAAEEWLKGLEGEGIENKVDVIRMESFESRWSTRVKSKSMGSSAKPPSQGGAGPGTTNSANGGNSAKNIWHQQQQQQQQHQSNLSLMHSHPSAHGNQYALPSQAGMMQLSYPHRPHNTALVFPNAQGQLTVNGTWQAVYNQGGQTLDCSIHGRFVIPFILSRSFVFALSGPLHISLYLQILKPLHISCL